MSSENLCATCFLLLKVDIFEKDANNDKEVT